MKGTGKRILSVSLSVMMALGMPSGTFAAGPDAEAAVQTSEAAPQVTETEVTPEVSAQVTEKPMVSETVQETTPEEKSQEKDVEEKKENVTEDVQDPTQKLKEDQSESSNKAADEQEKELPEVHVTKSELIETKTEYLVTVYTDSDVYDQLYIGKKEDTEKKTVVEGKKAPNGQYAFQFAVDADKLGTKLQIVPGIKSSGEWYTEQDVFCEIPEGTKQATVQNTEEVTENSIAVYEQAAENKGNAQVLKDGVAYEMFKISRTSAVIEGGVVKLTISTAKKSYNNIYIGKNEDENKTEMATLTEENNEYIFTLNISADQCGTTFPIVLKLGKDGTWSTKNQLYLSVPAIENLSVTTPEPSKTPTEEILADGTYTTTTDSNNKMFKVVDTKLTVKNGKITALFMLSSTGYEYLFLGTGAQAEGQEAQWIKWKDEVTYLSNGEEKTGRTYEVPIEALDKGINITAYSAKRKAWYDRVVTVNSKDLKKVDEGEITPKPSDTPTSTPTTTPAPSRPENVPTDGIYSATAETGAAMFKVVNTQLTIKNGKMSAVITLSGEGYDYLYMGSAADAASHTNQWIKYSGTATYTLDGETKTGRTYTIPVSGLDTKIALASRSERQKKWYDRTITISSQNLQKTGDIPAEGTPADGIYSTSAVTGAAMFKVVGTKLTVKNGKMTALITLSGVGYDYLYMGTAADAASHTGQWIRYNGEATYTLDGETKTGRTYEIPISALDKAIAVASHSESHNKWYDRTITFSSKDLKKIGDVSDSGNGNGGNNGNNGNGSNGTNSGNNGSNGGGSTTGNTTTKVDTKPDTESKYESDTSGSTKAVNSKTKLKDGVYKPDKFSWSGGTGKVSISCDKVTIKNGQALATIVFSSSSYQYVKADGKKYLPTHTGGKSIFVIPVELNKNNSIIGMTTKMSAAHEITYSILVYLAATDESGDGSVAADGSSSGLNFGSNEKLDEKAPDIIGLEYKSETKLDYAKYFKIYHYDKDVTLLEIDMTKDTDKDPEKLKEETATKDSEKTNTKTASKKNNKSGKKKAVKITIKRNNQDSKKSDTQSIAYNDEGEAVVQTQEEIIADLYKANVVKYLIVPEDSDVELPVGIEKEMIVIKLPVKRAYVDSEESLDTMDELKLLKKIATVGYDQDETDIDAVNKALEKGDMVYAGAADNLKFREIVKNKIDLAIVSSEILPGSETEKTAKGGTVATETVTEETSALDSLADNFATLGIPLIIDRSADEKSELAKAEWLKVYGTVFGCSKKTDQLYNKAVKATKSKQK